MVEAEVSSQWQMVVSKWLVQSGCLYSMAWGMRCSSWDDSVDMANIEHFNFEAIPEDKFVMTTWHEDQSLADVFGFCKNHAIHHTVDLRATVLLHISIQERESELMAAYADA